MYVKSKSWVRIPPEQLVFHFPWKTIFSLVVLPSLDSIDESHVAMYIITRRVASYTVYIVCKQLLLPLVHRKPFLCHILRLTYIIPQGLWYIAVGDHLVWCDAIAGV